MEKLKIKDLLRNGFHRETEVRDALFELYEYVFDEFFKILGSIFLLAALKFGYVKTSNLVVMGFYYIGVLLVCLKIYTYLAIILSESIWDIFEDTRERYSKTRNFIDSVLFFALPILIFYLLSSFITYLVSSVTLTSG